MTSNYQLSNDNFARQTGAPLNEAEMTSVKALLAFAAHHRNISEDIVRARVAKHFGVQDVAQLSSHSYDEVVRFLVDTQIDMLLN